MAYFDTTSPAGVLSREITATRNVLAAIGGAFSGIMARMAENASMNARVRKVHQLQALSDAELAKIKIKREDIVFHVFADIYYL
ncbi:DUF1127 domain-containing protein [Marimonas sp. MJW-29]|uniref:DUF1127 domain-containing protein n=1 Tax=Sulfitobacter sediminis TaxID=3234186 RepID=A0ABV3RJZ2_9RHOB